MTVDVGVAQVIERPLGEVSAFARDPANAPAWCRCVASAEWLTDPPTTLGSRITLRGRILGREHVATFDLVDVAPGSQMAMTTTGGPFPTRVTATWRALSDRATHMVLRVGIDVRGVQRLSSPLLAVGVRRALERDLAKLARLLERSAHLTVLAPTPDPYFAEASTTTDELIASPNSRFRLCGSEHNDGRTHRFPKLPIRSPDMERDPPERASDLVLAARTGFEPVPPP